MGLLALMTTYLSTCMLLLQLYYSVVLPQPPFLSSANEAASWVNAIVPPPWNLGHTDVCWDFRDRGPVIYYACRRTRSPLRGQVE